MTHAYETVKEFLERWRPFADLAATPVAAQILALLGEPDAAARGQKLAGLSDLYRLHVLYRELNMLRNGRNEKAERFAELLSLPLDDFAAAVVDGEPQSYLDLLQFCLEFGRYRLDSRQALMRRFLLQVFSLQKLGLGMKFSLYPGEVLFSTAGKTHDELAQSLARLGMGGPPLAGGTITRKAALEFHFDLKSTAYKATDNPEAVRGPLLRGIRITGGREDLMNLIYDERHIRKASQYPALRRSHRFG